VEPAPGAVFRVGDTVEVVPSHVCPVVNLHDRLLGVRGGRIEREIAIAARGRVR
jgi:D-serine deaminase-like pyridoxal phosphate-dependent protein